jgi:hypothetical protein
MKRYAWLLAPILIVVYCCNSEKRVLKDADKTQNVVNKYLQTHPARTDTVTRVKSGDTVTQLLIGYDTTLVRDTINKEITRTIYQTKIIIKHLTDTVERTITNNALLQACQEGLSGSEYKYKQATIEAKGSRLNADKWRLFFIAVIVAAAGSWVIYVLIRLKIF